MRILVTGAAGFIGSHLTSQLSRSGYYVHAVDALMETTYSSDTKKKRWAEMQGLKNVEFSVLDLSKVDLRNTLRGINVVINLAAMPGLQKSWEDFPQYLSSNVQVTQNILQALRYSPNTKLIQISTSSVYGLYAKSDENGDIKPISPYGVTKFAAEELVRAYAANFEIDYCILRYFSVYGPGQRADMAYAKFINRISQGLPIEVYGDGNQIRTNTFVTDCVQGTIDALDRFKSGKVYNISGEFEISLLDAISTIEDQLGTRAKLEFRPRAIGDQLETRGDHTQARLDFDYSPKIKPLEGLKIQVDAFKADQFFI